MWITQNPTNGDHYNDSFDTFDSLDNSDQTIHNGGGYG